MIIDLDYFLRISDLIRMDQVMPPPRNNNAAFSTNLPNDLGH